MTQTQTTERREFSKLDKSKCGVAVRKSLTVEQQREWDKSRSKFLWEQPAFASILYSMMDPSAHTDDRAIFTMDVPIAAADGKYLLLNPETFLKYKISERVFIIGHEVLHTMFGHCILLHNLIKIGEVRYSDGTKLKFHNQLFQVAMDMVINDILVQSQVGTMPKDAAHDPNLVTGNMSVIDAYRKLYNEDKKKGGNGDGSKLMPGLGKGFDVHLAPGKADGLPAEVAKQQHSQQEWDVAVKAAMENAQAQGKLPAYLKDMFTELLKPKVSWEEYIIAWIGRVIGSGTYSWRRPDRRAITREVAGLADDPIYMPGRQGFTCETVVVAVDTSGSINKPTLNMFFAEMSGVLESVKPKRLVVIWCDAIVQRVDEVEDSQDLMNLYHKDAPGRGGTAFEPVFKEIEEMGLEPDAVLYLTDLEGPLNFKKPSYPVLWGCITKHVAPWGTTVHIPPQV